MVLRQRKAPQNARGEGRRRWMSTQQRLVSAKPRRLEGWGESQAHQVWRQRRHLQPRKWGAGRGQFLSLRRLSCRISQRQLRQPETRNWWWWKKPCILRAPNLHLRKGKARWACLPGLNDQQCSSMLLLTLFAWFTHRRRGMLKRWGVWSSSQSRQKEASPCNTFQPPGLRSDGRLRSRLPRPPRSPKCRTEPPRLHKTAQPTWPRTVQKSPRKLLQSASGLLTNSTVTHQKKLPSPACRFKVLVCQEQFESD